MYQSLRSVSDNHVHLICLEGEFEHLPDYVRQQGPWQVMRRGDIVNLKAEYRLTLAREGWVLERSELALFKPEA